MQYNTVQYIAIQYSTMQYNTIQYNAIQHITVQYSTRECHFRLISWTGLVHYHRNARYIDIKIDI